MTKKLVQHGDSAALVIEKPMLQLLHIDMNTELEIITDGKSIIISPSHENENPPDLLESLARVNATHKKTLKRLAE